MICILYRIDQESILDSLVLQNTTAYYSKKKKNHWNFSNCNGSQHWALHILPTTGFKAYPQSTTSTRANSCYTVWLSEMVLTANTVRIRNGCLFMCTLLFGLFASNINADALNLKSINSSWKKANLYAAAVNQCAEEHAPDPNTLLKQMASLLPPLLFMPASLWRLNWSAEPGTFSFTHRITHLKKAAWQFSSCQIFPKQLLKKCLMLSRGGKNPTMKKQHQTLKLGLI